jgi:ribosomal protein S1
MEVGMEIDVKIKTSRTGDTIASINDALMDIKLKEIKDAIGNKTIGFTGKVKELIHGGYWIDIAGVKCFMPGSLGGLNKLHDFESLVGTEIIVMPITFSKDKSTIVVSHREYLRTMIPTRIRELGENIKEVRTGFVTGITSFGVFAQFDDCLTGLIPKAELTEEFQKSLDDRTIKAGDEIEFWAKEIISEKKIILSQLGPKVDLWDGIDEKYKPMMITEGTVTKITSYGAFVELEKGISGLIHKSKLKEVILTKGDIINIKIGSVNVSDRKITMNIV